MTRKQIFLSSVAAGALVLGLSAAPASAFDKLKWKWNLTIDEHVDKDVYIDVKVDPTGLVLLENMQVQVGDVKAESIVDGINNKQYDAGGGTQTVDLGTYNLGNINFTGERNLITGEVTGETEGDVVPDPELLSGTVNTFGKGVTMNFALGEIDLGEREIVVEPSGKFDARTELPEVVSAATAVGNNSSIESDVAVEVHEGQFLFDVSEGGEQRLSLPEIAAAVGIYELFDNNYGDVNTNHLLAGATLIGAVGGLVEKAEISAVSRVSNILNASVDSSATAVGNNKSITIDSIPGKNVVNGAYVTNSLLMGDITQVSLADVSASSTVRNVNLNDYTNLGKIDPVVNSVATAVGNNLSVTLKNGAFDTDN